MRWLLAVLAMLIVISIAGCTGQPAVNPAAPLNIITITSATLPPAAAPSTTATAPVTQIASPTVESATPRAGAATRTPFAPAPTRTDGLPVPAGARESKNIPQTVRDFMQSQLKGQRRIGTPQGYISPDGLEAVFEQYQNDLKSAGWDAIPLTSNLPDNTKLVIAQKDVRAIIAFVSEDATHTLIYIITTAR